MKEKKWPVSGLVILSILTLNAIMASYQGVVAGSAASVLTGVFMLFVLWNAYQYKRWAYKVLIFLFFLNCGLLVLFAVAGELPIMTAIVGIVINAIFIYYFRLPAMSSLFIQGESGLEDPNVEDAEFVDEDSDKDDDSSSPINS